MEFDEDVASKVSWTHMFNLPKMLDRFRFRGKADEELGGNSDHLLADDFTIGGGAGSGSGLRLGGGYAYADGYQYEQVCQAPVSIQRKKIA